MLEHESWETERYHQGQDKPKVEKRIQIMVIFDLK